MKIDELRARLTEISERLAEIDREFDGKRFSAEAKKEWNELHAEREESVSTIAELEQRAEQLRNAADVPGTRESGGAHFNTRVKSDGDIYDLASYRRDSSSPEEESTLLRDGAMRAVEGATFPHEEADRERVQAHVAKLIDRHSQDDNGGLARRILATGSPTYKRAFSKQLAGSPLTDSESRALGLGTTAGGFAVPFVLDPTIIPTSNGAVNPLRQLARIETVTVNEWKAVTSAGITAAYAAEGTEAGDNAPTLAQPDIVCDRAQAFVPYSIEIGGDWGALQSEMAKLLQIAKDELEAVKFATGAGHGSNEPKGFLTAATGTVAAGTAAFTVAHLYKLQQALAPRWRPNATFLAENSQYNLVRQFDTAGGANLWTQLEFDKPANLLGKPAYELSTMDSVLTAGSKILAYGDFSQFVIVDRLGMNVELIPHLFGASGRPIGKRGVYAIWRNSSDLTTVNAVKVLQTT